MEPRPRRRISPRKARLTILIGTAAVCLLVGPAACSRVPRGSQAAGAAGTEVPRLERSTALLERQLELANGKDFYLVLDPAAPDLTLMLRGAELRRFPVLGLQVGYPRVAWFGRRTSRTWQGVVWADGELEPPRLIDRIVVNAVEGPKGEEAAENPPIPPTPEEMYRVPSRYRIRFAGGFAVEVRPREGDTGAGRFARLRAWWTAKWGDAVSALRASDRDDVRLRVLLNPKDAESLYRSLPPSVRLLVLSGSPPRS